MAVIPAIAMATPTRTARLHAVHLAVVGSPAHVGSAEST
jgi:hypothetical protein